MMTQEKFYFDNPKSRLLNRSNEEIKSVISDYNDSDLKNSEIVQKNYFLKTWEPNLFQLLPFVLSDKKCEYCDHFLYKKIKKKGRLKQEIYTCISCHNYTTNTEYKSKDVDTTSEKCPSEWQEILRHFKHPTELEELSVLDQMKIFFLKYNLQTAPSAGIYLPDQTTTKKEKSQNKVSTEVIKVMQYCIERRFLIPSEVFDEENLFSEQNRNGSFPNPSHFVWDLNINLNGKRLNFERFFDIFPEYEYSEEELADLWKYIFRTELKYFTNSRARQLLKSDLNDSTLTYTSELLYGNKSLSKIFGLVEDALLSTLKNTYEPNPYYTQKINLHFKCAIEQIIERYPLSRTLVDYDCRKYKGYSELNALMMRHIFGADKNFYYLSHQNIMENYFQA